MFPSTACLIQHKIGAHHAWGFDLSAACSAFTYSLTTASQLVASGAHDHALVVGADVMSSIIDYTGSRRPACCSATARARSWSRRPSAGGGAILDFEHEIDGSGGAALCMPAGGSLQPPSHETDRSAAALREAGRADGVQVRRAQDRGDRAPPARAQRPDRRRPRSVRVAPGEPPHHPGGDREARRRSDKVIINIERFGNTTAATIPLALNDAVCSGRLKKGDLVLLASVGAGFTVGAVLLRWGF